MSTPVLYEHNNNAILDEIETLIPSYFPQWNPSQEDAGWVISQLFAKMTEEFGLELNRLPEKLFISYLDALGFTQSPPLSATAPICFELSKNFKNSVIISNKTQVSTKEKVVYETQNAFTASSAKLTSLYVADTQSNVVTDFSQNLLNEEMMALFNADIQEQYLYFADDALFNIHLPYGDSKAYIRYENAMFSKGNWEYWGRENEDEEPRWIAFQRTGNILNKEQVHSSVLEEINGINSYWIRSKLTPTLENISSYKIKYKSLSKADGLYCNDTSINPLKRIYPFGHQPQHGDTFYISSREAFSKKGFKMALKSMKVEVSSSKIEYGSGIIVFEYFNTSSWKPLKLISHDGDEHEVEFYLPEDLEMTTVNGDKNYWIRCKFVGGSYGTYTCSENNLVASFKPPFITSISITISQDSQLPKHIMRYAHEVYSDLTQSQESDPYAMIQEQRQSLYLGFDKPFEEGLVSLFVLLKSDDTLVTRNLLWEYYGQSAWNTLSVNDESSGFVKSGIFSFLAPTQHKSLSLFDKELYWIRIGFLEQTPRIECYGIYTNSVMAKQCKSISNELLGSSDGSAFQNYSLKYTPIVELKLWVLESHEPENEDYYKDNFDEGYWVRWLEVDTLSKSYENQRVYCFDAYTGTLNFGDDKTGKIPPIFKNGLMVNYSIGGGLEGNVAKGDISKLSSSIAYVESINNVENATGGADKQSLNRLIEMAPQRIVHGYRGVSADDYTALAFEASSNVAKVKTVSKKGAVDVFILPFSSEAKPSSSQGLINTVKEYIAPRCAITAELSVLDANFAEVSVEIEVIVEDLNIASGLKYNVQEHLNTFLHPLTGGFDERGWDFGKAPSLSDIFTLVAQLEGVSYIKELIIRISDELEGELVYKTDIFESEHIHSSSMIYSGIHNITVGDA